jgi:hypothetical protein
MLVVLGRQHVDGRGRRHFLQAEHQFFLEQSVQVL